MRRTRKEFRVKFTGLIYCNKMKNRKCNTFVTDANPKFNRKIVERDKINTL
jgi:hypothetical protein